MGLLYVIAVRSCLKNIEESNVNQEQCGRQLFVISLNDENPILGGCLYGGPLPYRRDSPFMSAIKWKMYSPPR